VGLAPVKVQPGLQRLAGVFIASLRATLIAPVLFVVKRPGLTLRLASTELAWRRP